MRTVRRGAPGTLCPQSAEGSRSTRKIVTRLLVLHAARIVSRRSGAAGTASLSVPRRVGFVFNPIPATKFLALDVGSFSNRAGALAALMLGHVEVVDSFVRHAGDLLRILSTTRRGGRLASDSLEALDALDLTEHSGT